MLVISQASAAEDKDAVLEKLARSGYDSGRCMQYFGHGSFYLLELFFGHVVEVGTNDFSTIAWVELLDGDSLKWSVFEKYARHIDPLGLFD